MRGSRVRAGSAFGRAQLRFYRHVPHAAPAMTVALPVLAIGGACAWRGPLAGGIALVAFLVFRIVEPFLAPIAWALFLGFLLQPTQAKLTHFMRGRASVSAFSLTILVLVLFLGPLTAIAIAFARQAAELAGRLQA